MTDKDMVWQDDFNPLGWALGLVHAAKKSKDGCASREFLFDSPLTDIHLHNYRIVWHYFQKSMDNDELCKVIILVRDDNCHIFGMCDLNGIAQDIVDKYYKKKED